MLKVWSTKHLRWIKKRSWRMIIVIFVLYFLNVSIATINKNRLTYPGTDLARRPVQHSEEISIPRFSSLPILLKHDKEISTSIEFSNCSRITLRYFEADLGSPQSFNQYKNWIILLKAWTYRRGFESLDPILKENNLLYLGMNIAFNGKRDRTLLSFFSQEINLLSVSL